MTESAHKQVYRRFVEEVINSGNVDVIPDLFDPEYVDHSTPPGAPAGTPYEQVAMIPRMFRGAFPDVHFTIEHMIEQGDWVCTRVTGYGQHLGMPFMGLPVSGRRASWSSMGMFRIKDGRIAEHYGAPDLMGLHAQVSAPAAPGSIDENRAVVGRFLFELNRQNFGAFDDYLDPGYVDHDPMPGQQPGIPGLKKAYRELCAAFPDMWFALQDLVAQDDMVIARGAVFGTNDGPLMGIPPTGKQIFWTATRMFRVKDGKLTEGWINLDMIGMLIQMGVVPPPPAA